MNNAEVAYAHITRPFACIDLDALDQNIAFVNGASGGKGIRVATKSVRSTVLLQYIAERLNNHAGWMTFDLKETLHLLQEGFDDLLLGYPQVEEEPMDRIIPYIREGRCVIFMIDRIEQWEWLDAIGKRNDVVFEICIDLNVSTDFKMIYFGTKRSSLRTIDCVNELLEFGNSFTHTVITGAMGYEAQIAGVPDSPVANWQSPLIKQLKRLSRKSVRDFRKSAVERIHEKSPTLRFVNGGGSGSIDFTSNEKEVTELTIGSAFYFPALFSRYRNLPLEPATAFALRITRKPEQGVVVCHGGGYIASGATGVDKNPEPDWPKNLSLLKNEGAGEVQTPLLDKKGALKIGDTVYFRHAKAGELCERFSELHARRGSVYEGTYKTYRGEGGCFL
ncbi:alanine racemase [Sporosarcina limicola]|uniref:D-serine deaminase-like pyridoxal phosphate-dependent protein n=1 Tax=Sporosarcina limicola TaxID=34101 RepID=A0A927MFR2_9BACL|nr:alanine racemase [Sporosarcina limicola]MBE1553879.1 D-serine deaminase-like pyridoxal phosphate-dependent protein [Sporosarcina limicola]